MAAGDLHDAGTAGGLSASINHARHELAAMLALWHGRHDRVTEWQATPAAHAQLAHGFIGVGAPLLALEVAAEGLEHFAADVGLRQAQGLALARSGSTEEANRVLEELRSEGHLDDETLGVLARTHKDLGLAATGAEARRHLDAALQRYGEAFARSGSYWTGINVATLAALQGNAARAVVVAGRVQADCRERLERLPEGDAQRYWVLATLGEAALVLGDWAAAEDWYRQAAESGRHRFGDLNATRRHARLLLEHFGRDPGLVDDWLPQAQVVLFSGHLVDKPGRTQERFPARYEPLVARTMRNWLAERRGLIGFASAACGGDILFLEAIRALGGETHIVLPYPPADFVKDSVAVAGGGNWPARFESLLTCSRVVIAAGCRPLHGGVAYDYANDLVHGLGKVRAADLQAELCALALWDGARGDGQGGTESAVRGWQRHGLAVHRLQLEIAAQEPAGPLPVTPLAPVETGSGASGAATTADRVMALLFADAVGFSRLSDLEVPRFVEHCLGLVARLIERDGPAIPVRETWGDGLFLAFHDVGVAGRFALDLIEAVAATDWLALGFTRPLLLRLALHAGPVHLTIDPVTKQPKCCGTHVSRAARLEPRTPPGQVYASEAFAALAALAGAAGFRCDYVRQFEWAKRYGSFPAYVVRRSA